MISILNKLIYSKCPNCKKHGIFFLKILTQGRSVCKCKYCNKKYFVHSVATVILTVFIFFILYLFVKGYLYDIIGEQNYKTLGNIIAIIIAYLGEYFAFIKEVEEDKKDS